MLLPPREIKTQELARAAQFAFDALLAQSGESRAGIEVFFDLELKQLDAVGLRPEVAKPVALAHLLLQDAGAAHYLELALKLDVKGELRCSLDTLARSFDPMFEPCHPDEVRTHLSAPEVQMVPDFGSMTRS